MSKLSKNQKGFTALEGLLIILILVAIGGVGYMVFHNNHKSKLLSASTSSTKSNNNKTASTTNPYAGWDTYSSSIANFSFKYPSSWNVGTGDNAPVKTSTNESFVLKAPVETIDGVQYEFEFNLQIYTPDSRPSNTDTVIYSSEKLNDSSYSSPLYALTYEVGKNLNGAPTTNIQGIGVSTTNYPAGSDDGSNDYIPTSTSNLQIDFGGGFITPDNNTVAYLTPSEFNASSSVKTALQIFSSISNK